MTPRVHLKPDLLALFGPRLAAYIPVLEAKHPAIWVGDVFDGLRAAVAVGNAPAISLACDFIEKDIRLPFGKLIKSNLARALRKQHGRLTETERRQVLGVTGWLLNLPYAPRELEDYCKLVKKFPADEIARILQTATPQNPKSARLVAGLREAD